MDNITAQSNPKRYFTHMELGFDESGYASFHATNTLHNSTLNSSLSFTITPSSLLCKADEENSKNLPNISLNSQNSITPFSHNKYNNATDQQTTGELQRTQSDASYPLAGQLSNCTPPFGSHERIATKRHKHQQHKQHASPKKSKKNLFPVTTTIGRTHFSNGVERLDIIGKLYMLPVLELILDELNPQTLDVMTHVSQQWRQIVHNNKNAMERLHVYHMKKRLTKENVPLNTSIQKRVSLNSNTVPLQNSNSASFSSQANTAHQCDSTQLLIVGSRVKCPCCGRSSQVFSSEQHNESLQLSQTLPPNSLRRTRFSFQFNSFDAGFSSAFSTPAVPTRASTPEEQHQTYAECTSATCRFKFCLTCSCAYHPGQKCPVTDIGTPSKMLFSNECTTPPKRTHKPESKLTRKKSLKRLCF